MAPDHSCDGELSGSQHSSQAAEPRDHPNELCDHVFNEITSNVNKCEYADLSNDDVIFTNELDSLILVHLNIRSLSKYSDDLHTFIASLPFKPDIISLSESRINQPSVNIDIEGYDFVHVKSKYGRAGGVAVYINVQIKFSQVQYFDFCGSETIWIKLRLSKNNKSLLIGTIYRHPKENMNNFIEDFSECLEKLASEDTTFYILGDINININESSKEALLVKKYTHAIISSGAVSLITKPTRVTDNSATTIDHIITNDVNHDIVPRVICNSMTDHYPITCKLSKIPVSRKHFNMPVYRDKSKFCSEDFSEDLFSKLENLMSCNLPLTRENFDAVFDQSVETIAGTIDRHAPQKRLSRKQAKLARKPWITKGILISIKKKNFMFKTHFINGNTIEKYLFRRYSNILTKIKTLSKKQHFYTEFAKNKTNARKTWEIIRSVLPNKSKREPPCSLKVNGTTSEDPITIANEFNNFFCTIGSNLADKIEEIPNQRPDDFYDKSVYDSMYLEPPKLTEVYDQIMALRDKAVGYDNIPSFFLKSAKHVITPFLQLFIDYMFSEGYFPSSCKIARITPIFKNGAKDETNNYRPISILTCFSKIIEKLIYTRLMEFFKKKKVIYENQYGFQSKISTLHALLDVVTTSYDNISSN